MSVTISGGGGVKSIQRGSVLVSSGSVGAEIIIAPVNAAKTSIKLATPSNVPTEITLTNSQLTLKSNSVTIQVYWEAVEYA